MLTLICGLPRAGKTTLSKQYSCKVLHLDHYGNFGRVRKKLNGEIGDVVVEGTYTHAMQRESLLNAYKGNDSKCIWLDTPLEVRQAREGFRPNMAEMHFYPPTLDEGWDEIIIIRGEHEQRIHR